MNNPQGWMKETKSRIAWAILAVLLAFLTAALTFGDAPARRVVSKDSGGSDEPSARNWGQWQNSLKPKGELASGIALAVGGETEYVIVIPESPTTQEQKAAEELQQWLGEMTGAEFAVD